MKNLKRIGSLILALAIALSLAVPAFAADTGYTDVSPDAWYAEAVTWCRENDIMNGTSTVNATFSPDDTLTRAMVATVLYRAEGEPAVSTDPQFTDADAGVWYSDAVVWADAEAIMQGYGNGRFGTGDPVTRQDLATILWRYAGEQDADAVSLPDASSVSEYARPAVNWAVGNGVLTLRDNGRVARGEAAVRAEVAVALMACLKDADLPKPAEPDEGGKALVVYFSASGSTERVAGYIADALNADTFELVPMEPYSSADLNWTVSDSRVNQEHENEALRDVKLVNNTVANWADYDTILIGYPIWWGIAAWPVNDFVQNNDFTGKTVIPFCTSTSSGLGQSGELLAAMAGTGDWQTGQRFSSGASQSEVSAWANGLSLN